jgi:hypothetical protein
MARKAGPLVNVDEVKKLAPYLSVEQMSDYFGISHDTFQRQCKREPKIMRAYKEGKARVITVIAQSLISKARDGDEKCQMFFLKTQAGWREKDREDKTAESVDTLAVSVSKLIDKLPG